MEKLENFARSRGMLVFFPQPPKDSVKKHFADKQTIRDLIRTFWEMLGERGKHACLLLVSGVTQRFYTCHVVVCTQSVSYEWKLILDV